MSWEELGAATRAGLPAGEVSIGGGIMKFGRDGLMDLKLDDVENVIMMVNRDSCCIGIKPAENGAANIRTLTKTDSGAGSVAITAAATLLGKDVSGGFARLPYKKTNGVAVVDLSTLPDKGQ